MIRFTKVVATNFLSFGQQPVELLLDTKNTRAILGVNDDIGEKGVSANGVGKSAIFNAILFGLFGKGIDKLKTDEFINIVNGKKLVVEVFFEKGDKKYQVRRGRKPNFVELTVDGESVTLDAMRNTDDQIIEVLGFNYDIFMTSFFLSPHRQSFMSMSGPEQRSMIETMLSLNVLAARAETLKTMRTDAQVEGKVVDRDIDRVTNMNSQCSATIQRLEEKSSVFERERDTGIRISKQELEDINSINTEELYKIFDEYTEYSSQSETLQTAVANINLTIGSVKELLRLHKDYNLKHTRLTESSKKFEEDLVESTKEAAAFVAAHPPVEELEVQLIHDEAVLLEQQTHAREVQEQTRFVQDTQRDFDINTEKLESISIEVSSHENGTCHVCGSDYVDADKLDSLRKKQRELRDTVEQTTLLLETAKDRLRELNTRPEASQPLPTESGIKQMRSDINQLRLMQTVLDESDKRENTYQKELDVLVTQIPTGNVEELEQEEKTLLDRHNRTSSELAILKHAISDYQEIFKELRVTKRQDIAEIEQKKVVIQQNIADWERKTNPFDEEITENRQNIIDVGELEEKKRSIEKKETHIGYLIKLLTDSKSFIRRRILENYIPYLNKKINEHAEKLGLPHVCEVNSDLTVSLTYMNRPVSYYNLSRGERLRLDLATTDAFRAMMGMLGKGCNLALLDEVLDSALDASGRHAALKFICESAETVLLITHRDELAAEVEDKIIVTKRNGFTHLTT